MNIARCTRPPGRLDRLHLAAAHAVLAHVDPVQELADILVLHEAGLVDEGRRPPDVVDVDALEVDLVLRVRALPHNRRPEHVDLPHALLPQEVADLAALPAVRDSELIGKCAYTRRNTFL